MMTPERYQQVKSLFHAAQALSADERRDFLAAECGGDDELRQAVADLLASSARADHFIEKAAYEILSATLVADAPDLAVAGKRIGAYKLLREINHGGMGTVYLAERDDDVYQKQVAVKIVRGGYASRELRQRFYDERRILARLDHPYIAKLLDGGTTDDGSPYYVMDYVAGLALNDYCEQNGLTISARLRLFRQVCEAVQYAHRNLVIHRDLKPSNILVNAEGVPQLLDFGIAKVFQDEEQAEATRTDLRVMTPEYASPEQLNGKAVTTASDIYSLGVILYELLTGSRPFRFKADSLEEIIRAVCETDPPRPSDASRRDGETGRRGEEEKRRQIAVKLSEASSNVAPSPRRPISPSQLKGDLDNIVLKALCKEPERRYSSVEQFSEDIRRHLEGLPVLARPDTFRYRSSKFVRRNKLGVAVAAGVALFLLAGAIAIVRQTRVAARAAQVAAAQRDKAQSEQAKAQREQAKAERINSFFQEMLAYANPSWYAPGYNKARDLTVVAALDEAARKIESELREEPEVKADILLTIGDTYASLGRFEPSERALEAALQLRREAHGEDSVKFADALFLLANTKRALYKREEMLQLYEQAYPIYRRHPAEESQFPYFLLDYAGTYAIRGDHAGAVSLTTEAVEMLRRQKGDAHNAVAVALENLGTAYHRWGDMEQALAQTRAAYEMMKPPTPFMMWKLGQIHLDRGELDEAEPLFAQAASHFERDNNLDWQTRTLFSLAYLRQARGEHRAAEVLAARAIAVDRRAYAPNHPALLGYLLTQGLILTRASKPKRGEEVIRGALKFMDEAQRKDLAWALGECLLAQKRYAEAEPLLRNHYRAREATQHPASPRLKKARELLLRLDSLRK